MSERKPRLDWKRVEIGSRNWHQHQAKVGELFDLIVDEKAGKVPAVWSVSFCKTNVELKSEPVTNIEAWKLAAEDYAFAELVKAVASFGASIVEPSK